MAWTEAPPRTRAGAKPRVPARSLSPVLGGRVGGRATVAGNHLEDLVAEWYQFQGFFVRRNVQVGKRSRGGYECELDIVAFHPGAKRLVHIEPSLDTHSWAERGRRYLKKFSAGRKHIPDLFQGVVLPKKLEQIALFVYGGRRGAPLAGGRVVVIGDFMQQVLAVVRQRHMATAAIPEEYPLLRTLQFAAEYWRSGRRGAA